MANRVKDILIDIGSGDLLFSTEKNKSIRYFDIIRWAAVYDSNQKLAYYNAYVYIPLSRINDLKADDDGRYILYFHVNYEPKDMPFTLYLVTDNGEGGYRGIDQSECAFPVLSWCVIPDTDSEELNVSELLYINVDGYYAANLIFVQNGQDVAYIYSAGNKDFGIGISDEQSAQLLSLCGLGKHYRYPLSGVDVTKYVNSVVGYSDLYKRISEEFNNDGIDAQNIGFDSSTGKIDVQFKHEENIVEPTVLIGVENLDDADITDDMLNEVAEYYDFETLDTDYDAVVPDDREIPEAKLKSCFANGIWIGDYPWTGKYLWKGTW